MLKSEKAKVDYKVLEDPYMAKQALQALLKTREELDDLIDTLEMLSDPRLRKNLERAIKEVNEGKAGKTLKYMLTDIGRLKVEKNLADLKKK